MTPSQLIRSLGHACRLLGLEREHAEAVAAGDDAPLEVALDLVDAMLEALERRLPDRAAPEPRTRVARHLVRIRELAAAGRSDREIAAELGRGVDAVRKLRARHGIAPGVRPGGASHATGWETTIRALHAEGLTTSHIADRAGFTLRTVQQRLHELGLRARPSRARGAGSSGQCRDSPDAPK